MAATDARPVPRRNAAFRVYLPILDADGDLVPAATGLDSEVSKDGGTFTDCTNEATEIATASGVYFLDLTATEMNADCVVVIVKTTTSGAKTTIITLYPEEIGDYRADVQQWLGAVPATPTVAGVPKVDVGHLLGTAVATPHTNGWFPATVKDGTGTGEIDTAAGRVALTEAQIDQIVDETWDEPKAGHAVANTYGAYVDVAVSTRTVPGDAMDLVTDAVDAAAVATTGVTEIQSGLATATALAAVATDVDQLQEAVSLRRGIAQAGGTTSITLDAAASGTDNLYNNHLVVTVAGTGAGQARFIRSYVGGTKVATVNRAWVTNPASDTVFHILPAESIWAQILADHQGAGSTGAALQTIDTIVDTIVAKTNQLTFTAANKVDAGILAAADFAQAAADKVWLTATRTLTGLGAAAVQEIWDRLTSALTTVGSIGKLLVDNVNAPVTTRATPAEVNAEVLDVIATDTFAEPPQEAPNATNTIERKLSYLFKAFRNKHTQTATTFSVYNDAGTVVDHKSAVSDDGSVFQRAEIQAGP
jgi:hypothetical protein